MNIIAVIAEKGGAGKTTTATNLAIAFTRQGLNTAVIDLDPQATAAKWADRRENTLPMVVSAHAARLDHEVKQMSEDGCEVLILDTAPHSDSIALAAAKDADCVLIATKPAIFDIETVEKTIDLVKSRNQSVVVLLNEVTPPKEAMNGQPLHTSETTQAFEYLRGLEVTVCPTPLSRRAAFKRAPLTGLGVQEFKADDEKAAAEIARVHEFMCAHMNIQPVSQGVQANVV